MSKFIHSEIIDGEIFIGNADTSAFPKEDEKVLKTIRIGNVALDINGNELNPSYMRPVFIHKSEEMALNRIMMNRMEKINNYKK